MAIVVLIGVVAAIVFLVVVNLRRKISAPTKPPIPSEPVKREKISKEPEKTSKFCRHCGAKIPHDSAFCESCGKKL
ncbi:zinc-ribbon domain-containing protein [Candidatus Bathyarchaeota archaeon]|nr:zinc-ribbon domain-containing protein [Candidatus Bathyarchaeota archaeon]